MSIPDLLPQFILSFVLVRPVCTCAWHHAHLCVCLSLFVLSCLCVILLAYFSLFCLPPLYQIDVPCSLACQKRVVLVTAVDPPFH